MKADQHQQGAMKPFLGRMTALLGGVCAVVLLVTPGTGFSFWLSGLVILAASGILLVLGQAVSSGKGKLVGQCLLFLAAGAFIVPLLVEAAVTSQARLFLLPLAACVLIASTHAYLGVHVVEREIIFVDLAFAQLASLGAVFSLVPWFEGMRFAVLLCSFAFVCLGALIFTLTRTEKHQIPQEAIIGIVYAVSTAFAILVGDRIPEGLERIKEVLVGRILWADGGEIVLTAKVYAAIMVVHLFCSGKFRALSSRDGTHGGRRVSRWWDLLFYVTFGIVIMRSVEIAGILLVFSLLVVPAVTAMLLLSGFRTRVLAGWGLASFAAALGIGLSYAFDLPAGPTIVCLLALELLVSGALRGIQASPFRWRTSLLMMTSGGAVTAVLIGLYLVSPSSRGIPDPHSHEHGGGEDVLHGVEDGSHSPGSLEEHLVEHFMEAEGEDRRELLSLVRSHTSGVMRLLSSDDPEMREKIASVLAEVGGGAPMARALEAAFAQEEDDWVRLAMATALLKIHRARGERAVSEILDSDAPGMVKGEARKLLGE